MKHQYRPRRAILFWPFQNLSFWGLNGYILRFMDVSERILETGNLIKSSYSFLGETLDGPSNNSLWLGTVQ